MPTGIYKRTRKPIADRFWPKVQRGDPSDCWEWTGAKFSGSYGMFRTDKVEKAHRVAYELTKGQIQDGLHVLHSCDNPRCCNPDHLRIGTHLENMRDRDERKRRKSPTGESNGRSKLTAEQVRQIRDRYVTGTVTQLELGREFGVTQRQISAIINRRVWIHVD